MDSMTSLIDPSAEEAADRERPPESGRKTLWRDVKMAGAYIKKYVKHDPIVGSLLILAEIGSGAINSLLFFRIQTEVAAITNALAAKNGGVIGGLLAKVTTACLIVAAVGMIVAWTRFTLKIRVRRVLTEDLLSKWIRNNRFYHLEQRSRLDYPEQRIQEDIFQFIDRVMTMAPAVIFSVFGIFLYTGRLWTMSPPIAFGSVGVIPGFLVYIAFGFAISWTLVTHLAGKSLTRAEVVRQRLEAQFRQEMATVRQNGESIAFSRGAAIEEEKLNNTFFLIRKNWRHYTFSNMKISFVAGIPELFMVVMPTLLLAPFVLKGKLQVGDIPLAAAAFQQVYGSVGVLIRQYADLAIFRSSVARLRRLEEMVSEPLASDILVLEAEDAEIRVHDLAIAFPDGQPMADVGDLEIAPGSRLLVQGRSGAGKSTLLRSIAGLWPFGRGEVSLPADARIAFLPQRGYMPNSSIAGLMSYPLPPEAHSESSYLELLRTLGLERLVPRLHDYDSWGDILSLGEQQRIAAARAILAEPDFLFVDEATSALDPQSEEIVYRLFSERLPNAALISVAHRPSVASFHDTVLQLKEGRATTALLEAGKH